MQNLQRAIIEANQKIDVLFFHACLMGMVEVADALWYTTLSYGPPRTNAVDYMVASENVMPYRADPPDVYFPYGEVLTDLTANPSMNGKTLSQTIVNKASVFYGSSGSVTLSAVELNGADPLKNFGNLIYDSMNLGNALETGVATSSYRAQVVTAMKQTHSLYEPEWRYVDLYEFASNVNAYVSDSITQSLAAKVMSDITDSSGPIVANYAGSDKIYAHGLSVFVPKSIQIIWKPTGTVILELKGYNTDYDPLDWSKGTYWNGFVRAYYGYFDYRVSISPAGQSVSAGGSTSFTVSVTLVSGSASQVQLSVRRIDPAAQATFLFDGTPTKTGTPPFTSTMTVSVGSGAANGDYTFFVYAISGKITRQVLAYISVSGGGTSKAADDPPSFDISESRGLAGSQTWLALPGATLSSPSASTYGDTTAFAVRGTDNGIYWAYLQQNTLEFYTWSWTSGATQSAPSIFLSGSTMYLAVRGTDNGIYWKTVDVGSGSQTSWRWVPGATNDSPSIFVSGSTMYLAVRGTDNGIYVNSVELTSGSLLDWGAMDGATLGAPVLAGASGETCGLFLLVRGPDNGIYIRTMVAYEDVA